ncbi:MAG: hypothetical protein EPN99_06975 [Frankiales bacterium]|nr:MAG: hypothetical protein EPN99_06975 [Frankiales bacterium]
MTSTLAPDATARRRTLLRADAALCAALGLPAAIAPAAVADLLGTGASTTLLRVVGVALVLYAVDLAVVSRLADRWQRPVVLVAGVGSLAWTAGTVALVVAGAFSTTGAVLALVAGVLTAELGVLQLRSASR